MCRTKDGISEQIKKTFAYTNVFSYKDLLSSVTELS